MAKKTDKFLKFLKDSYTDPFARILVLVVLAVTALTFLFSSFWLALIVVIVVLGLLIKFS